MISDVYNAKEFARHYKRSSKNNDYKFEFQNDQNDPELYEFIVKYLAREFQEDKKPGKQASR